MPVPKSFDYAVVRVVPRVERAEFINAGVILYCRSLDYLAARIFLEATRLRAVWPSSDLESLENHLALIPLICHGGKTGGPLAKLSRAERFHWLVAPRSTQIQLSPPHAGLCEDPGEMLEHLFKLMVLS